MTAIAVVIVAVDASGTRTDRRISTSPAPPRPPVKALGDPDPLLRDLIGFRVRYRDMIRRHDELVRTITVRYRAWNGDSRRALVVLPRWYEPWLNPPVPLVISPHGRGVQPQNNLRF